LAGGELDLKRRKKLLLYPLKEVLGKELSEHLAPESVAALRLVGEWTRSFVMSDHPELGREGNVCPFTSMAARIDTLRFGISEARSDEAVRIRSELAQVFDRLDQIPHPRQMDIHRAVLIGFPNCDDASGLATLTKVQKSLRLLSFRRARMIGLFHQHMEEPGLWNPKFRPLRSPLPVIAIRSLVLQDAAFVVRHPLLAPAYLVNFPLAGTRRLAARVQLQWS
jgi:hypothetical protein